MLTRRQTLQYIFAMRCCSGTAAKSAETEEFGSIKLLSKGFNLPDQFDENDGLRADVATLCQLRKLGMTHIRLPIPAEMFLPVFSSSDKITNRLDNLNRIVYQLLDLDYTISVDMHPRKKFKNLQMTAYTEAQNQLIAGWNGIAKSLRQWPDDKINVELLNEPAMPDQIWRPFAEFLTIQIRQYLGMNKIIVGPAPFQTIEALEKWVPIKDKNIIYAFHYYDPMIFTHQGATWDESTEWSQISDVPFPIESDSKLLKQLEQDAVNNGKLRAAKEIEMALGSSSNSQTINSQISRISKWKTKSRVAVLMNEFGVLRLKAKREDRLNWIRIVRRAAETNGIGWTYWDYDSSFGLLNEEGVIDDGVIHALMS